MRKFLFLLLIYTFTEGNSQSSVLSEGDWYKVGITETGLYKIDRATLTALGVGEIADPATIQLFGNGIKGELPQVNSESRPSDLLENAIWVSGESDGSFDQNDFILFYGVGPHQEEWSSEGFNFNRNIYSDTAYYFLRIGTEAGKRIASVDNPSLSPNQVVQSFDDHIVFEEDENNLLSSGRAWLGDILSSGETISNSYQIEGLISDINLSVLGVSQSPENGEFEVLTGSNRLGSFSIDEVPSGPNSIYAIKARAVLADFTIPQSENFEVSINYQSSGTNARGFLDRYVLTFQRQLGLYGNETHFRDQNGIGEIKEYRVQNAPGATIWNVSDPTNAYEQQFDLAANEAVFSSQSSTIEEFVIFQGNDFLSPWVFGSVGNQNLRADAAYDGIIISPPEFLNEANRLADFHRQHDNLSVKVVTPGQIYNEFSSGRQDVSAIRDYANHVYEEGSSLRYLLLFGDCSYDYKNRVPRNTNFVPTYESRNSFHPVFSYSSDDYFAFFDDDEGLWVESLNGDHTMEIGVGRLPIKSTEEARTVVDKIIYYSTNPNTLGNWRNEVVYVADDADANRHARDVEDLSQIIDTAYAAYNIGKILLDAYEQIAGPSKDLSPQTNQAIKTKLKDGVFVLNFLGHGNERVWTEEEILTRSDIDQLTNRNRLPVIVTATCEFGRYDDPFQVSGAEQLLLRGQGGAIALLTTSRPVIASTNFSLNEAFHENFFRKVDGENQRLGDIIRLTKNNGLEGPINRNFTLLGDPMMLPAFPKLDIVLDEFTEELDTLSALEEITLSGIIENGGQIQENFNGLLTASIFDVAQSFKTNGQESTPFTYSLRSNALFRGEAEVVNGRFSFSFIVPKNISYQFERGKISLYASDTDNNLDAIGSSREFLIGGTFENTPVDNESPLVSIYLNDDSFVNGGVVGRSSLFIADISDESGITTARSGVVEGITLDLNGESINLNDFYTASTAGYQQGKVIYPIQDLEAGRYSAELRVWDTHNNSSIETVDFVVTDQTQLFTFNELAYPNPVRKDQETLFYVEHDREDEDLSVTLLIYASNGEVVAKKEAVLQNSSRTIEIPWQATTDSGQRVNEGIYYYRIIIQSNFDGAIKEITQKLVVID